MPGIPRPCSPRRNTSHPTYAKSQRPEGPLASPLLSGPPNRQYPYRDLPQLHQVSTTPIFDHGPVLLYPGSPARPEPAGQSQLLPLTGLPIRQPASKSPEGPSGERKAEPPSCCVMDRIQKKYDEPSSQLDGQHLYIVLCFQSAIVTLLFLIFLCVPVAMITIGSLNLSNCKLSPAIPFCLVIAGCAYFLLPLLSAALDWNAQSSYCPVIITIVGAVAAVASTAGSVFVFRNAWPSTNRDDPHYCEPVLYYFSFAMWVAYICFVPVLITVTVFVFRRFSRINILKKHAQ